MVSKRDKEESAECTHSILTSPEQAELLLLRVLVAAHLYGLLIQTPVAYSHGRLW